jgi:amino acid adenylation domain-containing protein
MPHRDPLPMFPLYDTTTDYPSETTIHEYLDARAAGRRDQVAVRCGDQVLTYAGLEAASRTVAHALGEAGVRQGDIVGLMVGRSTEIFVGMLGILRAGAAYLPLDPSYPRDRLEYMIADSGAKGVIGGDPRIPEAHKLDIDIPLKNDRLWRGALEVRSSPTDLAYVIYTSGSTGRPKGVMIEHRSVLNLVTGLARAVDFTCGGAILAMTSIGFDIFVVESLLPLILGIPVVIAREQELLNPPALSRLVARHDVRILQATPTRMQLWLSSSEIVPLSAIERVLIGGEPVPKALLERLRAVTDARIYDVYGPTETTVWSTCKELTRADKVTVGQPIANTQVYVLDGSMRACRVDEEGEVYISGAGVARGYINQQRLTEDRFLPDPFVPGARVYRTGDRGVIDGNSELKLLGRMDSQVKIRGHRIELEEIEAVFLKHPNVRQAAVVVDDRDGHLSLAAYVVCDGTTPVLDARSHLQRFLPEYMVPSRIHHRATLPQTPNGKTDKRALVEEARAAASEPAGSGVADALARILDLGAGDPAAEIGAFFNVDVPLQLLLGATRRSALMEEVARAVAAAPASDAGARLLAPALRRPWHALSSAQQCYMTLAMAGGNSSACNIVATVRLESAPSPRAVGAAMDAVVRRHDALQAYFVEREGELVQTYAAEPRPVHVEEEDLQARAPAEQEQAVEACVARLYAKENGLSQWPLFRVRLLRLGPTRTVVVVAAHHLVADGYSLAILERELRQELEGARDVAEGVVRGYAETSELQNQLLATPAFEAEKAYWVNTLAQSPDTHFGPGGGKVGARSWSYAFRVPDLLAEAIRNACSTVHCTPNVFALSAFALTVARTLRRRSVSIGLPLLGRHTASEMRTIGMFAGMGLFSEELLPALTFEVLVRRASAHVLALQGQRAFWYHHFMEATGKQASADAFPISAVLFNNELSSTPTAEHLARISGRHRDMGRRIKFHLQALWRGDKTGMGAELIYRDDVMTADGVEEFARDYSDVLGRAVRTASASVCDLAGV